MNQAVIIVAVQSELRGGQVAGENADASLQVLVESRKIEVELECAPKPNRRLLGVLAAHQDV